MHIKRTNLRVPPASFSHTASGTCTSGRETLLYAIERSGRWYTYVPQGLKWRMLWHKVCTLIIITCSLHLRCVSLYIRIDHLNTNFVLNNHFTRREKVRPIETNNDLRKDNSFSSVFKWFNNQFLSIVFFLTRSISVGFNEKSGYIKMFYAWKIKGHVRNKYPYVFCGFLFIYCLFH